MTIKNTKKSALKAKLHFNNKTGYTGVRWAKQSNKWHAYIGFRGKQISLGYYSNKEDAIAARKEAEEKYHKPVLDGLEDELSPTD
ncbi:AP2 domain-containing protein [Bacillus sp. B15-48]|uniref:AP2 domain-containing protein n=1 Tax=Bacillus sp. B15-48 TaxID=1548601 RepID=UPI00193F7CD0|nr:AP2 domain-containing protein [Bacillus sp. B15-48]MBM4762694.1 hypothetical protein [Bacillus sp. B15-48]